MPTTSAQIDLLLLIPSEHERVEFKHGESHYDFEKLVDYCVALANERGGQFILGVSDRAPRKVVGTKAFPNHKEVSAAIHQRIHVKVVAEEVNHPMGRVLMFHVPSRPVGQAMQYKGRFMMRAGDTLVPMTSDEMRRITAEALPDWSVQSAMNECSSQDVVALLDTSCYFTLMKLPKPDSVEAILERFASEGLVEKSGSVWTITNLGAILFARNLEKFDTLSRKAPRVIVYNGNSKLSTKVDQIGKKGYAVGFSGLVDHVNGLMPSNEVIRKALRRDERMFPEIAVRELIANALIHQDFEETGASVMIEMYGDRIEISNPGVPFIPPERFIDDYKTRNERIADIMRRLGICEEKGSGVDKVVAYAEFYQLPAPDFRAMERRTSAIMFSHVDFEDMDRDARIRACYQHACLRYVMNQTMTNQSLRERFGLSENKGVVISQLISTTLEAGKIKITDPTQTSMRYRSYQPIWA